MKSFTQAPAFSFIYVAYFRPNGSDPHIPKKSRNRGLNDVFEIIQKVVKAFCIQK